MAMEFRRSGISVVGNIPWGTHFCHFYETTQDLIDTLVPYFKAGLEGKEYCVWVVTTPELITVEDAKRALQTEVPDLDHHLSASNIEILSAWDWYLEDNVFNLERVTSTWDAKLRHAVAAGYDGLRISGDTFWLDKKDWKDFCAYEKRLNDSFSNRPITALCTYPLSKIGAADIFDVVQTHRFAIAKRQGVWNINESPELIGAKAEIKRLNEELEQRVIQRTTELRVTNEQLRKEITDRTQIERKLRESQQQFESLVHSIDGIVWEVNADTFRFTFVSKRAERILGYPSLRWLEPNFWLDHLHPEDRDWAVGFCVDATQRRVNHQFEYRMIAANGQVVWLRDHVTVEVRMDDSILLRGVMLDITERKRAEEKLRQSESQLAEAQRVAHVGYWERNLDTGEIIWSDETYRILGLQPREPPRNVKELIHPEDRSLRDAAKARALRGDRYDVEYRVVRLDGEVRFVHSQGEASRDEWGRPYRVFGTVQDVTERKQAEQRVKATSDQLRALSARLQLAREEEGTRIAREIHDELGAALSSLRWDLEDVDEAISESGDPLLLAIRKKIDAMMRLTDTTINTVRRISSELRPIALDALGLIEAIEWQARQFQDRTGIIVQCDCAPERVDLTREQSTAVFRIFQEALTNILRHAQATRVTIQMNDEDNEFILTIEDNGRGITDYEKSGQRTLGLLGMRERAYLIGGNFDITGFPGNGTVVTVRVNHEQKNYSAASNQSKR
jgi:PAS domain S-box-containing protein